ncbi:MAG: hypothetical protein KDB04_07045 [Acidimicrobiales bacterium]|nr:hypothetical protein [Acidimicrobiales bacterium]HRW38524.1 hypothetical protein [Aquihabitans sp.]
MTAAPRLSRLWWVTGPLLALIVGAVVVVAALPTPYVTFAPGGARAVEPLVTVVPADGSPEVDVDPATDDLLYLTVSTSVEPSGLYVLRGLFDDAIQVEPSSGYLGTQSRDESRKLNLELMTDSQDKARKVALERLGYDVTATPQGAFLEDVDPSVPAAAVLRPGMTVVGAEGEPVRTRDDLVDAIEAAEPGDDLDLEVVPLGERTPESVEATLTERPSQPGKAVLGVSVADRVSYEFPIDIRIDSGKVGGPSAGLAFTLAILDRLTPGRLTGDGRVAVTGTIELDGSVGPVGGVQHKARAAIREGAELMLVPPDEYDEAVEAADGRLDVEAVASLDDALDALAAHGGSGLPPAAD